MLFHDLKFKIKDVAKLEIFIVFILLLLYVGALKIQVPLGSSGWHADLGAKNPLEKILAALSYLIIPLLVARKWKLCFHLLTKNILIVLLLFLTSISITWADTDLFTNISKVRGFLLSSLFGVYLAARFSVKEQTELMAGVFGFVIVASFFVALFVPGYGIHPHQGELNQLGGYWTGIFGHKNTLGPFMAWSAFIFLSLGLDKVNTIKRRIVLWLGLLFSVILVFLSGSGGSIVNLFGIFCIALIHKPARKTNYKLQMLLTIGTIILFTLISVLVVSNAQNLAGLIGKDLSLTGRIPLWNELLNYIAERPLLGYGFNGFWDSAQYGENFRGKWIWSSVPHSHNGFIELLLALGLVGFIIFVLDFIVELMKAYRQVDKIQTIEFIIPIQFLLTFLIANISEAKLLVANNLYWTIYIAIALSFEVNYIRKQKVKLYKVQG